MIVRGALRRVALPAVALLLGGATTAASAQASAQARTPARARLTSADVLRALDLPDTARVVIIHADDAAITSGANRATLDALRTRGISSASVLATTVHLAAFAAALSLGAPYDVGVHLALTSETPALRLPPAAPRDRVRSLVDGDGMLRIGLREDARTDEIERELDAQVARVRAAGIPLTHLDSHQGLLLYHGAARFDALRRVARRECLAIPVPESFFRRFPYLAGALDDGQPPLADLMSVDPATDAVHWEQQYIRLFATMRPGVTLLLVHLTDDGAEERAAFRDHTAYGFQWRRRDDVLARSGALREMARWHGVTVIRWADLARVARIC